ncbi:dimethylsulfonioproprionate lyase family protein [Roseibium sp.]|uniref:dimethylsulfonioproprionate lyase family protein n=1 Tax=Roseibium sp. TaxID=1936156 RepID=UPI0032630FD5
MMDVLKIALGNHLVAADLPEALTSGLKDSFARDWALPADPDTRAPVCNLLEAVAALAPIEGTIGQLASALVPVLPKLVWVVDYPEHSVLKERFGHAVLHLSPDLLIGCNILAAETDYPAHRHAADELYVPMTNGSTGYWQETGQTQHVSPGEIIRHASREAHAMRTGAEPVLNLWVQFGEAPGGPTWFT